MAAAENIRSFIDTNVKFMWFCVEAISCISYVRLQAHNDWGLHRQNRTMKNACTSNIINLIRQTKQRSHQPMNKFSHYEHGSSQGTHAIHASNSFARTCIKSIQHFFHKFLYEYHFVRFRNFSTIFPRAEWNKNN